jgi:hypothetical protein
VVDEAEDLIVWLETVNGIRMEFWDVANWARYDFVLANIAGIASLE